MKCLVNKGWRKLLFPITQKITSFFSLSHSPASLKTLTFYLEKCCFYSPVCPLSPLLHPHSLDSSAHLHTPLTVKGKTNPNTKSNLKFTYPQNQSLLVTWISTNPCSPLVQYSMTCSSSVCTYMSLFSSIFLRHTNTSASMNLLSGLCLFPLADGSIFSTSISTTPPLNMFKPFQTCLSNLIPLVLLQFFIKNCKLFFIKVVFFEPLLLVVTNLLSVWVSLLPFSFLVFKHVHLNSLVWIVLFGQISYV